VRMLETKNVSLTSASPNEAGSAPPAEPVFLNKTIAALAQLALCSVEARAWILSQRWKEVLAHDEGGELLVKILQSDLRPDEPASVTTFTARLEPNEEAAINALLREKISENAETVAQDCWRDLERRAMERRRDSLLSRLRAPELSPGEVTDLQKQILDLQKRLTDIARPLPPAG